MRVVCIVQARMGSSRLPGKVLELILGKPLLGYLLDRLERVPELSQIVVATTNQPQDDAVAEYCHSRAVEIYRGSSEDVLERYYEAAKKFQADIIVRITADCPLIDPAVVRQVVAHYVDKQDCYDYVSNTQDRSFPRGMDVEVCSLSALEAAHRNATDALEREHVTLHIYRRPEQFRIGSFEYRLTVDTPQDLLLIRQIIETLHPHGEEYTLADILQLLGRRPEWVKVNAHIRQK